MTEHHFKAFSPTLDHLHNDLGRVLQISVDRHHDLPVRDLQTGGQRCFFAEVAAQIDDTQTRIVPLMFKQALKRGIGTAVVDEHQFKVDQRLRLKDLIDSPQKRVEAVLFVKNGDHQR
ncbi:hypothetical protein D3C81_1461410 [compost metagenome]